MTFSTLDNHSDFETGLLNLQRISKQAVYIDAESRYVRTTCSELSVHISIPTLSTKLSASIQT